MIIIQDNQNILNEIGKTIRCFKFNRPSVPVEFIPKYISSNDLDYRTYLKIPLTDKKFELMRRHGMFMYVGVDHGERFAYPIPSYLAVKKKRHVPVIVCTEAIINDLSNIISHKFEDEILQVVFDKSDMINKVDSNEIEHVLMELAYMNSQMQKGILDKSFMVGYTFCKNGE